MSNYTFKNNEWLEKASEQPVKATSGFPDFLGDGQSNEYQELIESISVSEKGHFWFEARERLIKHFSEKFSAKGNYMEIGCGSGSILKIFHDAGYNVLGTDTNLLSLEKSFGKIGERNKLALMDALNIPFEGYFDMIGMYDVLEHIDSDVEVLAQINKALKKGGRVIITVPQHMCLWSKFDEFIHHKRRYSRKDLLKKLVAAGFSVERCTSFVMLLTPLVYVSRRLFSQEEFDISREYNISKMSNFVGRTSLFFELCLIKLGVSLPFGTSLVVVARKL